MLKALAEAVDRGNLGQLFPGTGSFTTAEDVRKIPAEGPWPDYLELHFEETGTGKRYRLVVETYHGTGGVWETET